MTPSGLVRYNDPIEYKADIADEDGDLLNVTLHILDEKGSGAKGNETLNMKPGPVSFKANEYGFFKEADAGKNFTYYYSFDDGINFVEKTEDYERTHYPQRSEALSGQAGLFQCQRELLLVGEVWIQSESKESES